MSFAGAFSGRLVGRFAGGRVALRFNAFEFDTGLGKSARALVQDGCLQLLDRLGKWNGGYLQAIDVTPAIVRSYDDDDQVGLIYDQLKGRSPAVLVAVGDQEFKPAGDVDRHNGELSVHVYVIVNSLRSNMSRQLGDVVSAADVTKDPGAFVILEHVYQLLAGAKVKVAGTRLRPVHELRVNGDNKFELWEVRFVCQLDRSVIGDKRDITLELTTLNTYSRLATQAPSDPALVTTETDLT